MELIRKAEADDDADFLRVGVHVLSQALMELEVSGRLRAVPTNGRPKGTVQWLPRATQGHPSGNDRASGTGAIAAAQKNLEIRCLS